VADLVSWLRARRHSVLLGVMVLMSIAQPITHGMWAGLLIYDVLLSALLFGLFAIVFERRRERWIALCFGLPALATRWAGYATDDREQFILEVLHLHFIIIFLTFAVFVIVRDIFRRNMLHTDDVMGALCGYLLAGTAFGSCYFLTELLVPGSFSVQPDIAWQMEEPHSRMFLFSYFSFCTLTTLGYEQMNVTGRTAASLSWLEAVFGQFYIAVIVAQLVGLRLAHTLHRLNQESSGSDERVTRSVDELLHQHSDD